MLFWEALNASTDERNHKTTNGSQTLTVRSRRLPYDTRCIAVTKSGARCRGRIRKGMETCLFHDPEMTAERRRRMAAKSAHTRRRLTHIPDGYLRKLTSISAVGEAMDRLYREVRLGTVTPEMGDLLFKILTRLADSGLVATGPCPQRTRAARIRPKLRELLTRQERAAWKKAVATAPASVSTPRPPAQPAAAVERALQKRQDPHKEAAAAAPRPLQAAS